MDLSRMPLMTLQRLYLDFLQHNSLSVELEWEPELDLELDLELLVVLGLISSLLLPSPTQCDPVCGEAGCGQCLLHLLPNAEQSDHLGRGTSCGRLLLPCHKHHAGEMRISYLSTCDDYLGEDYLQSVFVRRIPHLRVNETCSFHWFHADTTCEHSILSL
jgi:hypothetical protein